LNRLFPRAVLAFLALPGVVAFLAPWLLVRPISGRPIDLRGLVLLLPGLALLFWCVGMFYVSGKGTLAPWAPPRHLVTTGPYRYSRNPMYVAVVLVLWGWAAIFHSRGLVVYAAFVMVAFPLRVVLGEEPWLARTHGDAWTRYAASVPRWLGPARRT
jgi:protein-S-isoprenylcysteine O-methyltransferase Ste14